MTCQRIAIGLACVLGGGCFNPSSVDDGTTEATETGPTTGGMSSPGDDDDGGTPSTMDGTGTGTSGSPTTASTTPPADSGDTGPGTTDGADDTTTGGTPECSDVKGPPCPDEQYCVAGACQPPPDGMVAVPGGVFSMGCNEDTDPDCVADEYPYHEVHLDPYAIDRTEVTVADYQACAEAGQCPPMPATDDAGNGCDQNPGNLPATCVTWFDASGYCEWVDKRLPTEAEWEKAARGDDGRIFPWGDEPASCTLAVYAGCPPPASKQPVGSKPAGASPYGALDMAGNVFEWVEDWYSPSYYVESPPENPPGPDNGSRRIIRSAGPNYGDAALRNSFRGVDFEVPTPASTHTSVGFRCAVTPMP